MDFNTYLKPFLAQYDAGDRGMLSVPKSLLDQAQFDGNTSGMWRWADPSYENRQLWDNSMRESYDFLSKPDPYGKLRYGTDFSGLSPNQMNTGSFMDTGSNIFKKDGQDFFRLGSSYDEYLSTPELAKGIRSAGVQPSDILYDDQYGYYTRPEVATRLAPAMAEALGTRKGDSPLSAASMTVLPAMGLTAGLGALSGVEGFGFLAPEGGYQSLFSSLGQNAASQGGSFSDIFGSDAPWGVNAREGMFDLTNLDDPLVDEALFGGQTDIDKFMSGLGDIMRNPVSSNGAFLPPELLPLSSSGSLINSLATKVGPTAAKGLISKLLSGEANADDYAKLLGSIAPGVLGALGANQQTDALREISDRYLSMGQPFRDRLNASYSPDFDINSMPGFQNALDTASQGVLRNLSAKVGNPFDNPGALMEANKYVAGSLALPQLNTYRSQLGSFGQLGTNTAGTADMAGAQAEGSGLNAIGYGLNNLLNPSSDIETLLKRLSGGMGGLNFSLNNGSRF